MKEASGELSMTAIAVVAIGALAVLFTTIILPMIQRGIIQNTCETFGEGYKATKTKCDNGFAANDDVKEGDTTWYCCPPSA